MDIDLRLSFAINFRVGIPQEDGAIYSPDKAMFEVLAPHPGLEPSDHGRTFRSKDESFRIVATNPNRLKYPVSAERVSDGRAFKFPAKTPPCICSVLICEIHALSSAKSPNMQLRAAWRLLAAWGNGGHSGPEQTDDREIPRSNKDPT
ncbi:hypothetical protein [Roseovarius spongiae]|uniref:hypothetical protein n=1 Tax=Roseovarius spongiae TaxID=2320272 RepID=UPI0011C49FB9|nr:hypothetical protein [Roseovarius spongiae]